jgi:hypothetical protein
VATGTANTPAEPGLEYARRLYERVIAWYESAERKAQLILALDGVLLSFLTGSLLSTPDELRPIIEEFQMETWIFLALMGASLLASIGCAVGCVISRVYSRRRLDDILRHENVDPNRAETYTPGVLWFFQSVARLEPRGVYSRLLQAEQTLELEALATQVVPLARNVVAKHRLANFGFVFTGFALLWFLASGVSYAILIA